jgi:hypothetical protein
VDNLIWDYSWITYFLGEYKMYTWEIEVEESWSLDKNDWNNNNGKIVIAAESFEKAMEKAKKYFMRTNRSTCEGDDGEKFKLLAIRFTRVERKDELDA